MKAIKHYIISAVIVATGYLAYQDYMVREQLGASRYEVAKLRVMLDNKN